MPKTERILAQEDRADLQLVVDQLTSARVEYSHASIAFEELKARREGEERQLRTRILSLEMDLQELGKSLCSKYGIHLSEGSWALDVASGSFRSLVSDEEPHK